MRIVKLLIGAFLVLSLLVVAGAAVLYETTPLSNTGRNHFDVIIVLGNPSNADGSPSPVQRARVSESVREYRRGVAPALIMTGGAAHNQHFEADAMADFAAAQGVPSGVIFREKQAQNTIQNAYYSVKIMQAHGWKSAEVVSSRSHLPRASLIFSRFPVEYRMDGASSPPEIGWSQDCAAFVREAQSVDHIRLFGFTPSRYLP